MDIQDSYYDVLITRYLSGEATRSEIKELEVWVKKDEKNQETLKEYYSAWNLLKKDFIETDTDLDLEWEQLERKINGVPEQKNQVTPMHQVVFLNFTLQRVLQIAAVIIILLIPGYFLYNYLSIPLQKKMVASSNVLSGTLPDGSAVTLNAGSVLGYPAFFRGDKRNVTLEGEGYFEVSHNQKKPFIITAGEMRVKVTGTSFYVNTHYAEKKMEVILNKGSVILYFDNEPSKGIYLKPGNCAEIDMKDHRINVTVNEDPNFLAWKTHLIVFNDDSLGRVTQILNKVYRTHFTIASPKLTSCRLTATFNNQSLPSVLEVLKATLDLNFKKSGQNIEITGKGCE
ncbi:MAG: FecR domain-containing protein [Bacteroidota bacterium]|nr:FecR domain-containing protein [Bacteroidota bacterium]